MAIKVVIFDFDGVIADTETVHLRAFRQVLAPVRIEISEQDYYSKYLAFDDKTLFTVLLRENNLDSSEEAVAELVREKSLAVSSAIRKCAFFAGIENLIRGLAGDFSLAIASGALREEIESVLSRDGLLDFFSFVAAAEDCSKCKPNPEIFLRALQGVNEERTHLHIQAGQCVAIEDSPPGIAAAKAAGMKCIAVTNSYPRGSLSQADLIVESALEIDAETLVSF